ncbi:L,D-transpeptidase family protein [Vibrio gallaecicus]|uniref:Murein L,D-transpeptidase n=1 Tax=Vibrio gallaecicus TaxID=552386 RepID=A0ABV4NCC5_9VIBR
MLVRLFCGLLLLTSFQVWSLTGLYERGWIPESSSLKFYVLYPELTESFYTDSSSALLWNDSEASEMLEFQLSIIDRSEISPLFERQLKRLRFYREQELWFEHDILSMDTLIFYLSYSENAPLIGKPWYFEDKLHAKLPKPSPHLLFNLKRNLESNTLKEFVLSYAPPVGDYKQFKHSYSLLEDSIVEPIELYHQLGLKRKGDELLDRSSLIKRMSLVGINTQLIEPDIVYFDETLEVALLDFQAMHGLKADGVIGPKTMAWINMSPERRLHSLSLNAERARLWPQERDSMILVNVPSFDMKYWSDGEEVFESKVVVGKLSRKTPLLTTKLDSVILNPTWNVPWKIMVEDILPKVKADSTYLQRHNFEVIEKWRSPESLNPDDIDWASINPRAFPYKMRQQAGVKNALGLYKFNTPNRRAIYLHDTPSKGLFDTDRRAYSSGCVRVEDAEEFAELLIQKHTKKNFEDSTALKANTRVQLRKRIPVHIIYQTVLFEDEGIQYRSDIYKYDSMSNEG